MHCSICHKNAGTVSLKHVVNGVTQDIVVCQECAAKNGFDSQLPIPLLTDFLMGEAAAPSHPADDQACVACHMHQTDFHKTSLLGCPACYTAFQGELEGLLSTMHRGTRHFGKVPRKRLAGYLRAIERGITAAEAEKDAVVAERLRQHLRRLVRQVAARPMRGQPVGGTEPEMTLE
ncbi:MAG: hypothetical protein K8T26_07165 [Lentisphaerae bacterium]|nr:hypothetical protein [Lentisphaerota bacterium]